MYLCRRPSDATRGSIPNPITILQKEAPIKMTGFLSVESEIFSTVGPSRICTTATKKTRKNYGNSTVDDCKVPTSLSDETPWIDPLRDAIRKRSV